MDRDGPFAAWHFTAREPVTQSAVDRVLSTVGPQKSGYAGMFEALAGALSGRGGRELSVEDGRRSLEFVTAVYASARAGAL
ncbi:MAG: hypothetical protein VXY93_05805 [Pseudomonadota bacterium]|nr:hypothetical protein [Pseudomonadota bacterium]